ncbi:MAG TPA: flagellar motor protein MotB, partial [Gemmatimonadales bacterium]|nr:flagellar motor protein MotB [Gemmatimonadales bacterium]
MKSEREQVIRVVRKRRAAHGHHGGAWKVAFADFMTSMMALFLVLWLITQSSEVRTAIAGYFQDPLGRAKQFGSSVIPGEGQPLLPSKPTVQITMSDGRRERLIRLSERIRKALPDSADLAGLRDHVTIEITDDGLRISLLEDSTDVFFASGNPKPLPRAVSLFNAIGGVLGSTGYDVVVEGHTDALPYRDRQDYDNWELSAGRANSVRRAMLTGGLEPKQVAAVRGLADREPRIPEDPLAPQNRR